ncbi:hypothetical protein ABZS71_06495 [Streptomyces sp. NPDC005393]|uniref:hypothetical protein n=1 Tax=Streptomyces sp. NPDC005393 TaxID=3157041 RepID=UPI0033BA854A
MQSIAFPWLSKLSDERAYEFVGEVIEAAHTVGAHTAFLGTLDQLISAWAVTAEAVGVVRDALEEAGPP